MAATISLDESGHPQNQPMAFIPSAEGIEATDQLDYSLTEAFAVENEVASQAPLPVPTEPIKPLSTPTSLIPSRGDGALFGLVILATLYTLYFARALLLTVVLEFYFLFCYPLLFAPCTAFVYRKRLAP